MNRLYVGFLKRIELPEGGFLFIGDEAGKAKGAKVFDPKKDSFNPLAHLDYRSAADFVDIIDSIFSRGENTLAKDTGLDFIAECLDRKPKSLEQLIPPPGKGRYDGSYLGAREDSANPSLADLAARVVQTEDEQPQRPASRFKDLRAAEPRRVGRLRRACARAIPHGVF